MIVEHRGVIGTVIIEDGECHASGLVDGVLIESEKSKDSDLLVQRNWNAIVDKYLG